MFCKECGKEIENDSKFCSYCGTRQSIQPIVEQSVEQDIKPNASSQKINVNINLGRPKIKDENLNKEPVKIEKYDLAYKGDIEATVIGVVVVFLNIFMYFIRPFENADNPQLVTAIIILIDFILRVFVTIWIVKIAKRQNRNTTGWGIFAFILPTLALIIIGLLKKLYKPINESNSTVLKPDFEISTDEKEDTLQNPQSESAEETIEHFEIGSTGFISYSSDITNKVVADRISYQVVNIKNTYPSRKKARSEFTIEFSDGKKGSLSYSYYRRRYFIENEKDFNYFVDKELVINALHYYLNYNKILSEAEFDTLHK
jgi:hypothetical protein